MLQRTLFKFFYVFICIICIKILVNWRKLIQCRRFYKFYMNYLANKNQEFSGYIPIIKKLFYDAKLKESWLSYTELAGYGFVETGKLNLFDNMHLKRQDVVDLINVCFKQAITVFKQNIEDAINPLYWLDFIVFLPRHIATYLNVSPGKVGIKIFQIIWWLLNIIYVIFRNEFNSLFKSLIEKLIK